LKTMPGLGKSGTSRMNFSITAVRGGGVGSGGEERALSGRWGPG
jgi:hypothetical protein